MEFLNELGEVVRVSKPLTQPGGEGTVYELAGSAEWLAKVYHPHRIPDAQKVAKLQHQIRAAKPELLGIGAWPKHVLVDVRDRRRVVGFVMPRARGKEIHRLYGPRDRQLEFPGATWDFLVHVARNCAAAFETLHENGIVMADVNEGNLLVNNDGYVRLIDCDSYQINNGGSKFLCNVGVPLWTPPELQGKDYVGLERTPNHDRFGLAVIIFLLLFMGRHPYAGIPTGREQYEIGEAIRLFLFAFSPKTWARGVRAPAGALALRAVPGKVAEMFERAFLQGSQGVGGRPTGREWAQELGGLLAARKTCHFDQGHKFWNGLTSCPWCEIAIAGGPNFFISAALGLVNWTADFAKFWAAIEQVVHGALMSEQVAVPAIGRATAKPMPLARPQAPGLSAPLAPAKPAPLPRPVVAAPVLPVMPVMAPPARLPAVPLGRSESVARMCFLGTCFFGLAVLLCFNLDLSAAAMGAGWGTVTCLIVALMKAGQAKVEMRQRKEAEGAARAEERRVASEEHAQRMSEYEAQVEELTKKHALAVAQAEAEYRREWLKQDQEYQRAYNDYLTKQRVYDDAQRKYADEVTVWNAEVDARTTTEERVRRGLNAAVGRLEAVLSAYKAQVNMTYSALVAAKQRFDKARADELDDLRALQLKKRDVQLQQFLGSQLIRSAQIMGIGRVKTATLAAYSCSSAADIHRGMDVPGIGEVLLGNLMDWRRDCEGRFRYNPNTPLPPAEVRAIKLKHGQAQQSALVEVRAGAADLSSKETQARASVSAMKLEILTLARQHAQGIADVNACS